MPAIPSRSASLVVAFVSLAGCASLRPADRTAWQSDFDALLAHMPVGYANLEYSVRTRGLNAESLVTATRARIASARTERGERAAIAGFLKAFGDYHISLQTAGPMPSAGGAVSFASCGQLGFRSRDRSFHRSLRDQPGFAEIPGSLLPLATFTNEGRTIYALRIPLFSPTQFPDLCESLWPRFAAAGKACDERCASALLHAVGDSAIADLGARLQAPSSGAPLVVDLTGNGGGSEWAIEVARRLTSRQLTMPALGMVRHAHWRGNLQRRLAATTDAAEKARIDTLLRALDTPCDWTAIWKGGPTPTCSPLVMNPAHPDDEFGKRAPIWRGPLLIVADGGTASASEQFMAMLVDAGAARVVGAPTMGIGCGFTNGGIDFRLPASGLRVRLPDCARFRRDGTNERAGIKPGAGAWTDQSDASTRAATVAAAVRSMLR